MTAARRKEIDRHADALFLELDASIAQINKDMIAELLADAAYWRNAIATAKPGHTSEEWEVDDCPFCGSEVVVFTEAEDHAPGCAYLAAREA